MSDVTELVRCDAPKLKRDWNGRRIVTLRPLTTGSAIVPAGKLGRIDWHSAGRTHLIFDACGCCGVKAVVSVKHGHGSAFAFVADDPLL